MQKWFTWQGSHKPGEGLELDLGPEKLVEFKKKNAFCPGIFLEFCKIILEIWISLWKYKIQQARSDLWDALKKNCVKIARNWVKVAVCTSKSEVRLVFYSIQFVR